MAEQSLTEKIAELFAKTDFTPAPPPLRPVVVARPPADSGRRLRDDRDDLRRAVSSEKAGCQHKWEVRSGKRTCWLCGESGGTVDRPQLVKVKTIGRTELAARMAAAQRIAGEKGHEMRAWKSRPNDQYGRWNSFCATCARLAVVGASAAPGLPLVYGEALSEPCGQRKKIQGSGQCPF